MKVVDASVAIKWVYEETSGVQTARALLARPELLIAPPLWLLEIGNVIQRKLGKNLVSEEEARAAYAFLTDLPIALIDEAGLAAEAFDLAIRLGHPTYDCAYLALGRRRASPLVTADVELAKVAARHGLEDMVELIGPDQP